MKLHPQSRPNAHATTTDHGGGWQAHGACVGRDPELWFPPAGHNPTQARAICAACPVLDQCRAYADQHEGPRGRELVHGVWAAETADQRVARRRHTRSPK